MSSKKQLSVSRSVTDDSIYSFLHALDTPISLSVWLLYKYKEHDQLAKFSIDPANYDSVDSFRDDYAAACFLSKADFLSTTFDKKKVAMTKFDEFEERCAVTNFCILHPSSDLQNKGPNQWLLNATIRKIYGILSEYVPAEEFVDGLSWGPGVSTRIKSRNACKPNKYLLEKGITDTLYPWFRDLRLASQVSKDWESILTASDGTYKLDLERGNRLCSVPKNSKTDRIIAIEPGMNMLCQKSIGSMIRRRLLRAGIDLNSQARNQMLAQRAYSEKLATVDFSSASDSISREVVKLLLPPDWWSIIDKTRSHNFVANGVVRRWNKLSSMGNGFTFELESLIFFAAASAVCEYLDVRGEISVYGDDVILPADAYKLYSSYCEFLGFKVNHEKSFSHGPFFESCGSHYFRGVDVQPIFLKEKIINVQAVYKLANSIRLLAHRRNNYYGCDAKFRATYYSIRNRVPKHLRFLVPASNPNGGFISNFDEATPLRARSGWDGYRYSSLISQPIRKRLDHLGLLIAKIWDLRCTDTCSNNTTRGRHWLLPQDIIYIIQTAPKTSETSKSALVSSGDEEYTLYSSNNVAIRGRVTYRIKRTCFTHNWYNIGDWW